MMKNILLGGLLILAVSALVATSGCSEEKAPEKAAPEKAAPAEAVPAEAVEGK